MNYLRLATLDDLEAIYSMYLDTRRQMEKEGNFTWNDEYPNKDFFLSDIKNKCLYMYYEDGSFVGHCALDYDVFSYFFEESKNLAKYNEILIKTKCLNGKPNFMIERFMVSPNAQSKGIGSRFLKEILEMEKDKNAFACVYKVNSKALSFYQKNGFKEYGDTYFAEWGKDFDSSCCYLLVNPKGA